MAEAERILACRDLEQFDVFVVYHDDDIHIEKIIFPLLEENDVSYCYLDRDGEPSKRTLDNAERLMKMSKKILFVVSDIFMKNRRLKLLLLNAIESRTRMDIITFVTDEKLTSCDEVRKSSVVRYPSSTWQKQLIDNLHVELGGFVSLIETSRTTDLLYLRGLCITNFCYELYGLMLTCGQKCFRVDLEEYSKHRELHKQYNTIDVCKQCRWIFKRNTTLSLSMKNTGSLSESFKATERSISELIVGVMDPLEGNDSLFTPTWDLGCTVSGEYNGEHQHYISKFHKKTQALLKNKTLSRQEVPCYPQFQDYAERLNSFSGYATEKERPSDKTLATAGFFRTKSNIAKCYFCGFSIFDWERNYNPLNLHSSYRPECFFIRTLDNEDREALREFKNAKISDFHNTFESRLATFKTFDKSLILSKCLSDSECKQVIESLADAGYYHVENGTVECFSCRLALFYNFTDEQPWHLHASLSPNCEYLLQEKGQEFVNAIQSGMRRGGGGQTVVTFLLKMLNTDHRQEWNDYIFFPRYSKNCPIASCQSNRPAST